MNSGRKPFDSWSKTSRGHRGDPPHLKDYGILGPGGVLGAGDWRQRNDVRRLPTAEREDLELWIMERAYLYCRALGQRPDSHTDWERALTILDRVSGTLRIPAFDPLRRRLLDKLGAGGPACPGSVLATTGAPMARRAPARLRGRVRAHVSRRSPPSSARLVGPIGDPRSPDPHGRAGGSAITASRWRFAPIPSGHIAARRPSATIWVGSPKPPVTWSGAWSDAPRTPCSAGSSPAA